MPLERPLLAKKMGGSDHLMVVPQVGNSGNSDDLETKNPVTMMMSKSESTKRRRGILRHRSNSESLTASCCSSSCTDSNEDDEDLPTKVRYSTVEIHEHAIIIGDNPGCSAGPPLSIDWLCEKKRVFSFADYEENRPSRRNRGSMHMSKDDRIKLFKKLGYSARDIIRLTKPVNIARAKRCKTNETIQMQGLHESAEKLSRNLKNALTLGRRKRRERKFLEPYASKAKRNEDMSTNSSCSNSYEDEDEEELSLKETEESSLDMVMDVDVCPAPAVVCSD